MSEKKIEELTKALVEELDQHAPHMNVQRGEAEELARFLFGVWREGEEKKR